MTQPPEKDLYAILGVSPEATPEEIREAYRARARVLHPDRFDRELQPKDWDKANEMLSELNHAYSILSNARRRREYDRLRATRFQHQPPPPPPTHDPPRSPPFPFAVGDLTSGQARYADLPNHVQARLLNRQKGRDKEQFQLRLASVTRNYVFALALLAWFWHLLAAVDGPKWTQRAILWYTSCTLVVSLLLARNLARILRWRRSTLKPFFYVTPLYFIKTDYDFVSFRPIWTLKNVAVTHNYKNGLYEYSDILLRFEGHEEYLQLFSKKQVEQMLERINTYTSRLHSAYATRDYRYFKMHNDFAGVPSSPIPSTLTARKDVGFHIYAVSLIACGVVLLAAMEANDYRADRRGVPQAAAPYAPPTLLQVTRPPVPEQPLPPNGRLQTFTTAQRLAPLEIKGGQGSHYLVKLVDAFTAAPVLTVFVHSGSSVKIDVPLGTFELRFASGRKWYGDDYLFGPDTVYSKAETTFTFEAVGDEVRGFTVTLYQVPHGNLSVSRITPTEF